MKTLFALLLTLSTTVALAQPHPQQKTRGNELKQDSQSTGPIAGGGGYVTKNSLKALDKARKQLVSQLGSTADIVFSGLPPEWDRKRLIEVIWNVRNSSKKPNMQRNDIDLEFNYGHDEKGEYIEALPAFFKAHSSTPVNLEDEDKLKILYAEIGLKMLHEAAHLMGIGTTEATDEDAEMFAKELYSKMSRQITVCTFPEKETFEKAKATMLDPNEVPSIWIIQSVLGKTIKSAMRTNNPRIVRLKENARLFTEQDYDIGSAIYEEVVPYFISRRNTPEYFEFHTSGTFFDVLDDDQHQGITLTTYTDYKTLLGLESRVAVMELKNHYMQKSQKVIGKCRSHAKPIIDLTDSSNIHPILEPNFRKGQ